MGNDKLMSVIEEIKNWCKSNNIVCFIGSTQDEPFMVYSYAKESNDDWRNFLQIAKSLDVKIIVLEKEINFLKENFELLMSEDDLNPRMKESYETVLAHNDEIALVKLSFHYNEIYYKFSIISGWFSDYSFVSKMIEKAEDDYESSDYSDPILSNEQSIKRLTEPEVEEYARNIIEKDDFVKAKNRIQKEEIIKRTLKDILGNEFIETPNYYWPVIKRTEELFEIGVKPEIEKEIKKKVLELKAQGLKKVEIRSKLDISIGMVDRFFYKD